MTWDEAMHAKCMTCGEQAQQHRLSNGGTFYCLREKGRGGNESRKKYWYTTTKVGNLMKSPLPKKLGEFINQGFRKLEQGDQLTL